MAEYYPLLARAVAGLKTSTPQSRRAIYERARGALLAQLRAMNPPVPEPDIQRESDALDAAIARLEAENDAAGAPPAPSPAENAAQAQAQQAEAAAQAQAAEAQRAKAEQAERARAAEAEKAKAEEAERAKAAAEAERAKAVEAAKARAAEQARLDEAKRREEERLAAERAARQHAEQEARLAAEKREREARERRDAEQAQARRIAEEQAAARESAEAAHAVPAPAPPTPGEKPAAPTPPAAPAAPGPTPPAGAASAPAAPGHRPAPPSAKPAAPIPPIAPPPSAVAKPAPAAPTIPPAAPTSGAGARAPDVVAYDEPLRDPAAAPPVAIRAHAADAPLRDDPFADFAAERDLVEEGAPAPELGADQRARPLRPAAPLPPPERPSRLRYVVAGGALAVVMAGIGYAAWLLRDKPQELPRPRTAADEPAKPAESGGKINDRIAVSPSAPLPTVQAPAQTIRPAGEPASPAAQPPVAQQPAQLAPARAAFLIQSDGPDPHKTYSGVVNWRVENGAWRADLSVPEVKFAGSFVMSKNADGGPASHKIELRFQFDDPAYQIARVGVPELRKEENPYGDRLAAVAVPVTPNLYLIGLRKDDADVAYNLELLRARGWIDVPMEMADKRIAKITFEKGPAGDRTFAEAVKGW